ncbi:hypothetical protein CEK62_00380 [Alcanivorax sp. N3-2A]|nr:hypothetical protein CEK62_00380 [Alcanivorax sp. N3-2A]
MALLRRRVGAVLDREPSLKGEVGLAELFRGQGPLPHKKTAPKGRPRLLTNPALSGVRRFWAVIRGSGERSYGSDRLEESGPDRKDESPLGDEERAEAFTRPVKRLETTLQAANAIFFKFCAAADSNACSRIPARPRIRVLGGSGGGFGGALYSP